MEKRKVRIDGERTKSKRGAAIVVPAGASHNIVNAGSKSLKLYTRYAPPQHQDGVVRATKAGAPATEGHFDGKTTESAASAKFASSRGAPVKPNT
ncbi:MAG: hypothetical protein ABI056_03610 [Caulobacteraceae bacterium]